MKILTIICVILLMAGSVVFAEDVPYDVMEEIKEAAAQEHPNDYSLQKFTINMETRAYIAIQNYSNDRIPHDVLKKIMDRAAQEHPNDYSLQKFTIDMEVKAYLDIND